MTWFLVKWNVIYGELYTFAIKNYLAGTCTYCKMFSLVYISSIALNDIFFYARVIINYICIL